MRDAFVAELMDLAAEDPDLLLLSGDIGYGVFDKFREAFPGRFINMGVAEQNMVGVAAGMALTGKRPVVYTIVPFATMRCFEQIRVDVCMHDLPVKIVGVGGGLAYGTLGPTHHAIEDIAIMRSLPNMKVVVPATPSDTKRMTRIAVKADGPVYIRLGKNGEPDLTNDGDYGRLDSEVVIIGCGPILAEAFKARDMLEEAGVMCCVVNARSIKPMAILAPAALRLGIKCVVTLEEHSVIGGLGSAVAELIAECPSPKLLFKRIGIEDKFVTEVGSQKYLWEQCGLTAPHIVKTVKELLS